MKKVGAALSDEISYSGRGTLPDRRSGTVKYFSIRQKAGAFATLLLLIGLTGCGEELSCSAEATKQLMAQIARTEIKKGFPPGDPTPDKIGLVLKEIITTDRTKTRATCKAKFEVNTPEAPAGDLPVTYHVEKTDDGRLYVTIFGL